HGFETFGNLPEYPGIESDGRSLRRRFLLLRTLDRASELESDAAKDRMVLGVAALIDDLAIAIAGIECDRLRQVDRHARHQRIGEAVLILAVIDARPAITSAGADIRGEHRRG